VTSRLCPFPNFTTATTWGRLLAHRNFAARRSLARSLRGAVPWAQAKPCTLLSYVFYAVRKFGSKHGRLAAHFQLFEVTSLKLYLLNVLAVLMLRAEWRPTTPRSQSMRLRPPNSIYNIPKVIHYSSPYILFVMFIQFSVHILLSLCLSPLRNILRSHEETRIKIATPLSAFPRLVIRTNT